jgi:hypothetical protein
MKWSKKQKTRSKVRKSKPLNENIEEDRSSRNTDHRQLIKRKNPPTDALEHFVGKKERQAGETLKIRVKWT